MRQHELKTFTREDSDQPPRVYGLDHAIVIELYGEIDLVAYQRAVALMDAVTAGPEAVVVIDLSRITFIDCSGLSLLMRAHRRVTARGGRLCIVCSHRLTLRMLRVTKLTAALSPAPTLSAALLDPPNHEAS